MSFHRRYDKYIFMESCKLVILVFWGKVSVSLFRLFFLAKQNTLTIRHWPALCDSRTSKRATRDQAAAMGPILAGSKLMQMDVIFGKMVLYENVLFGLVS